MDFRVEYIGITVASFSRKYSDIFTIAHFPANHTSLPLVDNLNGARHRSQGTDSRLTLYGKRFQTIAAMLYIGMINDDEVIKRRVPIG
ncbi:MAG: hypothetical protein QME63_05235 [Actinomycetota bacterium]|nr:hypothetical protein [Actinomycetota bacterium]